MNLGQIGCWFIMKNESCLRCPPACAHSGCMRLQRWDMERVGNWSLLQCLSGRPCIPHFFPKYGSSLKVNSGKNPNGVSHRHDASESRKENSSYSIDFQKIFLFLLTSRLPEEHLSFSLAWELCLPSPPRNAKDS